MLLNGSVGWNGMERYFVTIDNDNGVSYWYLFCWFNNITILWFLAVVELENLRFAVDIVCFAKEWVVK